MVSPFQVSVPIVLPWTNYCCWYVHCLFAHRRCGRGSHWLRTCTWHVHGRLQRYQHRTRSAQRAGFCMRALQGAIAASQTAASTSRRRSGLKPGPGVSAGQRSSMASTPAPHLPSDSRPVQVGRRPGVAELEGDADGFGGGRFARRLKDQRRLHAKLRQDEGLSRAMSAMLLACNNSSRHMSLRCAARMSRTG